MDRNLTILLAEDNEDYALILKRAMAANGWKNPVQIVPDGNEAINYLSGEGKYADRDTYAFPYVMFLDIKMPKATGLDVLRWVKEHPKCSVLPTMMLSSSDEQRDVKLAYELGANAYFIKPGGFDDLKRLLRVAYDFWELTVRPTKPADLSHS
jgi:CheY-like chemotaxis protein